jgi:hypothetical protein
MEGIIRCTGCGQWLMASFINCQICNTKTTTKGNSNAESNHMGGIMLGARETEKGAD